MTQQQQQLRHEPAGLQANGTGQSEGAAAAEEEATQPYQKRTRVRELTRGLEEQTGVKEGLQALLSQQLRELENVKVNHLPHVHTLPFGNHA